MRAAEYSIQLSNSINIDEILVNARATCSPAIVIRKLLYRAKPNQELLSDLSNALDFFGYDEVQFVARRCVLIRFCGERGWATGPPYCSPLLDTNLETKCLTQQQLWPTRLQVYSRRLLSFHRPNSFFCPGNTELQNELGFRGDGRFKL